MALSRTLLRIYVLFSVLTAIHAFSLSMITTLRMQTASTKLPPTATWGQRPFNAADFAGHIEAAVNVHAETIAHAMAASPTTICCIDGFLGEDACREMRKEAEAIRDAGKLEECESSGQVRATQVDLDLSQELGQSLVTEQDGSSYKRHVDNSFMPGDVRKLTVLYYLNPDYTPSLGGRFRAFDCRSVRVAGPDAHRRAELLPEQESASFAPRGDRLVIFWTDALVHEVAPSTLSEVDNVAALLPEARADVSALPGAETHRWALTVWMVTSDPKRALAHGVPDAVLRRHFRGPLQKELQRTADRARRFVARLRHGGGR